ncbi:MAG: hypothetical protein HGA49_01125 [Eubacteriaceae bacterium]|nr:hypothetical protein [Eubacteriaceae bacterium]
MNTKKNSYMTRYGKITGATFPGFYEDGSLKECFLSEVNKINTSLGVLIPHYRDDEVRKKNTTSISFYPNGRLKSILLDERILVSTIAGDILAEMISFYEDGSIKRIFPLFGRITPYWDEKDEYTLTEDLKIKTTVGELTTRLMGLCLYSEGGIRSITFWPNEKIRVNTPLGELDVRTGISFYNNGAVKSVEPAKPEKIQTPDGELPAFDFNVIGVNGDDNSLKFHQDGRIKSFVSFMKTIEL